MNQRHAHSLKTPLMKQLRPLLAKGPYHRASHLLLSVSGGMDSMVLLDIFFRMQHVHQSPLGVLHIHHHTGRFADLASQLVQKHCHTLEVPCTVAEYRWNGQGNFEFEAARFRRNCLKTNLKPAGYSVLAHHRDDQLETLLQTLTRGAGASTPLGMSPQRGASLRPLLHVDRKTIAQHAEKAEVPHLLDPSNNDTTNFRNAIRHNIAPILNRFHQGFAGNLDGWLEDYRAIQTGLIKQAAPLFEQYFQNGILNRKVFQECPKHLWDFVLASFWDAFEVAKPARANRNRLHAWLEDQKIGSFDHEGRRFWCDSDGLTFAAPAETGSVTSELDRETHWGDWGFRLRRGNSGSHHIFQGEQTRFTLKPGSPFPKYMKEAMRLASVPQRIRAITPRFVIGEKEYQLTEMIEALANGHIVLEHLYGPNPLRWLDSKHGGVMK